MAQFKGTNAELSYKGSDGKWVKFKMKPRGDRRTNLHPNYNRGNYIVLPIPSRAPIGRCVYYIWCRRCKKRVATVADSHRIMISMHEIVSHGYSEHTYGVNVPSVQVNNISGWIIEG